ncbi:phytase [Pseudarthrobacter oxydans]|uniref:phytase n=1 Tax=Pseudarthrobacter oxydans TaxID=1671 RepID=UPI0015719CE4|nr:phytase [Pseudarthrobacter oxydans]NSX36816.1 phytase [Pseudarthrobacter oxydans]
MLRLFRILAAATVALAAVGAFTLINVFGSTAVAAPTTVTLNAAADTYLSTASPNSNFGRAKTLAVSDTTYRALLRFNVSLPSGSTVTNIALRLYSNTSVSGSLIVHPASNSWSETTVTANNQPAWQTAELARSGLLRARQYASAALPTNAITGSGNFNVGIDTTTGVQGSLDSREGAKRPQLVITYDSPSSPTPTPTSTATPTSTPTSTAPGSAPQNIRIDPAYTTDLEHTARFLWDPVPNATNYRHYINGAAIAGEDDTSASETVRNLQPATAYTFSVGAFVGGVEYKSAPFSFTTAGPGSTPTSTATPTPSISTVLPLVENVGFSGSGDISDDAVIWADTATPANSVVIADNKSVSAGGIGVFGMDGKLIQFRQDGMLGNVDLRSGFVLSGQPIILVGANNRTNDTLVLYSFSATTRTLTPVTARSIPTVSPNIGFCLYHSRASGKFYAFVTPQQAGSVQQFELVDNGAGLVDAVLVRTLPMSSIAESCVADDELGHLYVGQETVAVWKYGAEPSAGSNRVSVDTAGSGRLVAEIEGMSISYGANGTGRLFVSSQGDSTIVVYDRADNNPFVKKFRVGSNGTIDSVTGTDGLDVTTRNAGPGFEQGLLVVHDESNSGGTTSNLKYVPLSAVLG